MDDSELLRQLQLRLGQGPTPAVSGITVGRLYWRFRATRPKGRAWQMIRSLLREFVVRFWREPCSAVTAERYEAFRNERMTRRTRMKKLPKPSTVNLELARAIQLFRFGVRSKLFATNVLADVERLPSRKGRETWLTQEQFDKLLAATWVLKEHRRIVMARALFIAMVETGMRIGEALRIRRDHISIDGTYTIPAARTKTKRSRPVAFTDRALAAFSAVAPIGNSPFVFASTYKTKRGLPIEFTAPREWFRKVVEAAGLDAVVADGDDRLRCHDLRHSAASIADSLGAPALAIRDLLGHSSLATTQRYLHRSREQSALDMARLMEGRRAPKRATRETNSNEKIDSDIRLRST